MWHVVSGELTVERALDPRVLVTRARELAAT
jgi:hypothetical protein